MSAVSNKLVFRSEALSKVRSFFYNRGLIEVDCPALENHASVDLYIEPIETECGYLHTSPEYGMKKLLALGAPDIFQLSHVFRREEKGTRHRPEFTMLEWYRKTLTLDELIQECLDLIAIFVPNITYERLSWKEAFTRYLGIDPFKISKEEFLPCLESLTLSQAILDSSLDTLLDLAFSELIEPKFPPGMVIQGFPARSAALAKIGKDSAGNLVALRFEIYVKGCEVANGYDELGANSGSGNELKKRFEQTLINREKENLRTFSLDEQLFAALDKMPECVGVAMGFDRLLMLAIGATDIQDVLPL